jgi:transposase
MDLEGFYGAYRTDGHVRAAYEPSMMVALILYAFATGVRSSRAIERHCREHVVYRVITGNLLPDRVKVRTEWRLRMMAHNFTKLYNHQIAALEA